MADYADSILNHTQQILEKLGLPGEVSVEITEDYYNIQIDVEQTGILIGYHGETLLSIQMILSQIIFRETGEWVHISVNVGDYQEKREEQLKAMADRAVDESLEDQRSVTLPYLNSKERRIIHMYLKENEQITTESIGTSSQRRLVIFPS